MVDGLWLWRLHLCSVRLLMGMLMMRCIEFECLLQVMLMMMMMMRQLLLMVGLRFDERTAAIGCHNNGRRILLHELVLLLLLLLLVLLTMVMA